MISNRTSEEARKQKADAMATASPLPERFLILTRETGPAAIGLMKVLEPLGLVEIITDNPANGQPVLDGHPLPLPGTDEDSALTSMRNHRAVFVDDDEAADFGGLMSGSGPFPKITAWSRAMAYLKRDHQPDQGVWFVEDDVAGDSAAFTELVRRTVEAHVDLAAMDIRTRDEDRGWPHWHYADGLFDEPCRGFQPLCRLSGHLVRRVLDFQSEHRRFTFHEVLFASIALRWGMTLLSWNDDLRYQSIFATFHYRPLVARTEHGISHPVKDIRVHREICSLLPDHPRQPWYEQDLNRWKLLFGTHKIARILEIGCGTKETGNRMLREIFTHPSSELHGIDTVDPSIPERTIASQEAGPETSGHPGDLNTYEGMPCEILAWMIADEGYWESFDFIYFNTPGDHEMLCIAAFQAWLLLKTGGILIFGEESLIPLSKDTKQTVADTFLSVFGNRTKYLFGGARVALLKQAT